jgi:hypothetical protein
VPRNQKAPCGQAWAEKIGSGASGVGHATTPARLAIEHAQDLVTSPIRQFEQHAVDTCFAVRREYRLVCRCIEHGD